MFILACLIGIYLCVKAAEKKEIPIPISLNVLFVAFIFTILGARLHYIVQHYQFFLIFPVEIFKLWKGGFSSFGGMIVGSISVLIYLRKERISIWKFADCCEWMLFWKNLKYSLGDKFPQGKCTIYVTDIIRTNFPKRFNVFASSSDSTVSFFFRFNNTFCPTHFPKKDDI